MNKTRFLLTLTILVCLATSAAAAEVFLPRYPALNPDGRIVVFSFQGDLWSVPATGGQARRLTAHEAYDSHPVFSPNGALMPIPSFRSGLTDHMA